MYQDVSVCIYKKGASFEKPPDEIHPVEAGIPPGKSDASGSIGPKHIVTSTSGFSTRCRLMRPIFPVELS